MENGGVIGFGGNGGGNGAGGNGAANGGGGNAGANGAGGHGALELAVDRAQKVMNQMLGRCGKRPCLSFRSDRPLKKRRLNEDGEFADAEFFGGSNDVAMDEVTGFGAMAMHPGHFAVTVAESTGSGALFDWNGFHDVALAEHLMALGTPANNGQPAGAVYVVEMSKQAFVSQVIKKLSLRFHGYKVVLEETGSYRASIEFDLPRVATRRYRKRKKFYGLDENGKYAAMESACEAALSHLMMDCHVVVKDMSYSKLEFLEYKCAAAESYNKQFMELVKAKDNQWMKVSLGLCNAVTLAHYMCKNSGDVLPPRFTASDGSVGYGMDRVVYSGRTPPITPVDKLASAFGRLMDDVMNVIQMRPK